MKRCPQCEFIYEDEQVTCDMDGVILAFDKTSTVVNGQRSMVKSFAVPALVGTASAVVLCLAFYSSPLLVANPEGPPVAPEQMPATPVSAPSPIPPAIEVPSPLPSPPPLSEPSRDKQAANSARTSDANHANPSTSDSRLTIKRGLPPLPRVPTLPRLPPARVRKISANDKVQITTSQPKKQSKVESFLKKTGRVITKPFKF